MSVNIRFTVPPTPDTIVQVNVYESATQTGTFVLVYSETITNSSTVVTYAGGTPTYWYKISFVDSDGNESELSPAVTGTSPLITGTYVPMANTGNGRKDNIINNMLTPRLERFRQLCVYRGERFTYQRNPLKATYGNWLTYAPLRAWRNSLHVNEDTSAGELNIVDSRLGLFEVSPQLERGEELNVLYYFDYFPDYILSAMIEQALMMLNAYEPGTAYTMASAPSYFDGLIAEQTYVLCVEKMIFDVTLWQPRLIFAEPDAVSGQLDSSLGGARERLSSLVTTQKSMPYVSPPTWAYFDAIQMGAGHASFHGMSVGYGRTRGIKINRWFGR